MIPFFISEVLFKSPLGVLADKIWAQAADAGRGDGDSLHAFVFHHDPLRLSGGNSSDYAADVRVPAGAGRAGTGSAVAVALCVCRGCGGGKQARRGDGIAECRVHDRHCVLVSCRRVCGRQLWADLCQAGDVRGSARPLQRPLPGTGAYDWAALASRAASAHGPAAARRHHPADAAL